MKNSEILEILNKTEAGYDRMAEKFSGTRNFFWPELDFIKERIFEGERVMDFGCGNGRLLELFKDKQIQYQGVDVSQKLIDLAGARYIGSDRKFTKISGQSILPFPDDFFNAIVSVAVFHHFPDQKFRLAAAKELFRVTQSGGKIIVTVWNLWQKKYKKYIWKNRIRKMFFLSRLDWSDCEIPFKNNADETFFRFHHAYTVKDLTSLFSQAGFEIEKVEMLNNKNLVLIGKKT